MSEHLTPEQLAEIRRRNELTLHASHTYMEAIGQAEWDRSLLLTEVDRLAAELAELQGQNALTEAHFGTYVEDAILREGKLRSQRAALLALHKYDELVFGGFYCTHCTPEDADDNVRWPCASLRAVGVTDEEAVAIIEAHRAGIERKAAAERAAQEVTDRA